MAKVYTDLFVLNAEDRERFFNIPQTAGEYVIGSSGIEHHPGEIAAEEQGLSEGDVVSLHVFKEAAEGNPEFHFVIGPEHKVSTFFIERESNGRLSITGATHMISVQEMVELMLIAHK